MTPTAHHADLGDDDVLPEDDTAEARACESCGALPSEPCDATCPTVANDEEG